MGRHAGKRLISIAGESSDAISRRWISEGFTQLCVAVAFKRDFQPELSKNELPEDAPSGLSSGN